MQPFCYGTFWAKDPLGGDASEIPLVDGALPSTSAEPPFSDGRIQRFMRSRAEDQPDFSASFLFGRSDWIDCRPVIDIAREFKTINPATGGQMVLVDNAGHQVMMDNPRGFALVVCNLASGKQQ